MPHNPYQAPRASAPVRGVLSGRKEDLYKVAHAQKVILLCILFYFFAAVASGAVPAELQILPILLILAIAAVAMVFVLVLAIRVYSGPVGILLGLLTLVPLIGLFVLLAVNGKATRILKENGFRVGLLGAKLSDIRAA